MTTYQSRSRGEVRTHTGFCPADFESTASANSATLEEGGIYTTCEHARKSLPNCRKYDAICD